MLAILLFAAFAACYGYHQDAPLRTVFSNDGIDMHMRHRVREAVTTSDIPTKNYMQTVDHTGHVAGRFAQRYYVNATFYKPGGPVFVYLGGEGPMELFLEEVQMFRWAKEFNAMYILLEHRYYGKSNPVPDFSTKNMFLLSSQQALADAAEFMQWYNATFLAPKLKTQFMIYGCSYSGALSGWFRLLYPELVVGSFAPSGPVHAQTNFTGYLHQFGTTAGTACSEAVAAGVQQISSILMNPTGMAQLSKTFNTCTPLTKENLYYFKWTIGVTFAGEAQEDLPPTWPVKNIICATVLNASSPATPAEKVAAALRPFLGGSCMAIDEMAYIQSMKNNSLQANYDGGRAWFWQKCREFGYFKPAYPGTSPFWGDLHVEHMVNWCSQVFNIDGMEPDADGTNRYYGGKHLNATKVAITQGSLDPWHLLGIDMDEGDVKSYLYKAGHCAPLHHHTMDDPPSLKFVRTKITGLIKKYLGV